MAVALAAPVAATAVLLPPAASARLQLARQARGSGLRRALVPPSRFWGQSIQPAHIATSTTAFPHSTYPSIMSPSATAQNSWHAAAPTWEELKDRLSSAGTMYQEEQPEDARITLYRDHNAWCPYCHRVWLQLEEKGISYKTVKLNLRAKPDWYYDINPSGQVPAILLDGKIVTDSARIMRVIEEEFRDVSPLLPDKSYQTRSGAFSNKRIGYFDTVASGDERVDGLLKLERMLAKQWLAWITASPWSWGAGGKNEFLQAVAQVEAELKTSGGPYFLGELYSMVDVTFAPFLERIHSSILYFKGLDIRASGEYPCLTGWYDAMDSRSAYVKLKGTHYVHAHALPPQIGELGVAAEAKEAARSIDMEAASLRLSEPGMMAEEPRLRAAAKLVNNHGMVVDHAMRGLGEKSPRVAEVADVGYRLLAHALIAGAEGLGSAPESALKAEDALARSWNKDGTPAGAAAGLLAYTRDRTCIPRDLDLTTAKVFQAHINEVVAAITKQRSPSLAV
eukprot:jgi/Chlat1/7473/Chrsp6S07477